MTMTKRTTVQQVGRRTRLSNRDVRAMLDALIAVWAEELARGGRVEIEHFLVLEVHTVAYAANRLLPARRYRRVTVRASKRLRERLNGG